MDDARIGVSLLDWALGLLAAHAYLITLAATTLENTFVVGSFIPGETLLLAAGFVSSASTGEPVYPAAVAVTAVIGCMIGSNISYALGHHGGRPFLDKYGHRIRMGERRLTEAEAFFDRHGSRTLLFARFAPGVKNYAPMLAGVSHMNLALFEVFSLLGAIGYSVVMVALGYFFGSNFDLLLKVVGRVGVGLVVVVVAVVLTWLWHRRRAEVRREAEIERFTHEVEPAGDGADDVED